ncbi:MAG TPA: alpha/beta hydrolase [Vicinamibacterales bacterium]|nr:alpha/beta hydrolase [Vicinamibacterales bacterium]
MQTDLSLKYLVHVPSRRPDSEEMPLVVVMHGRGADMHDLADLAPMMDPPRGCRFVFPNAPRAWEAAPGMTFGWTWFDGWPPERNSVAKSRETLLRFVDEAKARYPTSQVIIAGFSQGGMMALEVGLRSDVAGIVVLSGGLYEEDLPTLSPRRVFLAHGTFDDVVPVAYARRARLVLEGHGFDVEYHEYPMGHQVVGEEIDAARAFIGRCLAAAR